MRRLGWIGLLSVLALPATAATVRYDTTTTPIVETDAAGGHRPHVIANGMNGGTPRPLNVDGNGNLTSASASGTATGTLTAAAQTVAFSTSSYGAAGLQVTGTWVATLVFEGSVDGSTWFSLPAFNPVAGTFVMATSTTANGQGRVNTAGLQNVRVRCSAYTSGTASVTWFGQGFTSSGNVVHLGDPNTLNIAQVGTWGNADANNATNPGILAGSFGLIYNGASWDRARSVAGDAQTATGIGAGTPMVWNGATYDRLKGDSTGSARVSLYGKNAVAGDTPVSVISASDAMGIGNVGVITHSLNHLYDGVNAANYARNNNEIAGLASAARTVTTSTPDTINYNGRGVQAILNVTAASGTGGLTLTVQGKDPVSGTYYNLNVAPTAVTATGITVYEIYPGVGAASGGITQRTSGIVPRTFRVLVTHGDASSYTYSVAIVDVL